MNRLEQSERETQASLRQLAGILSRARLDEGDVGDAADLLLSAGFHPRDDDDDTLLERADRGCTAP
jgi:hypothetical protein